jgi:uncharacterized protein
MIYALVTGGSKGIGKEMSYLLAKQGFGLLLVARSTEELEKVALDITEKYNVPTSFLAQDLSQVSSPQIIKNWIDENHFEVVILINNAGYGLWGMFEKIPIEFQKNMMQVNMNALVELTYLMLPLLKKQKKSYLMNISSTASYQAVPALAVYAATKSFVLLFTRALKFELKNTNISVTCYSPGATDTNFTNRAGMQAMQAVAAKFNMEAITVAEIGIKAMFAGKAEVIPGFVNILSALATNFLPKSIIEGIAANLYLKFLK